MALIEFLSRKRGGRGLLLGLLLIGVCVCCAVLSQRYSSSVVGKGDVAGGRGLFVEAASGVEKEEPMVYEDDAGEVEKGVEEEEKVEKEGEEKKEGEEEKEKEEKEEPEEEKEEEKEEDKEKKEEEEGKIIPMTDEEEKFLAGIDEGEEDKLASEKHQYQAEVNRLMDIIINSLYTQKEVFLRELISNSADALEKVRFLSVSTPEEDVLGEKKNLDIRIDFDKEGKTISIQDSGIGMSKQDLINNLGTVAKSGTSNFLEAIAAGGDVNLIGQFGVGFYSAFLVADKVSVYSKSNEDKQQVWISKADGSFSIAEDPRGNTLGRGTRITLHLKEDATEFLNESKLRDLVSKYSQFISFPIYIKTEKSETKEVEEEVEVKKEGEEGEKKEKKEGEEDEMDVEEGETKKEKRMKKITVKVPRWELMNTQKAIWLRPKEEVTDKEYKDFYKAVTKDWSDPLTYIHFTGEGEIEFKSILYIPPRAPSDMFDNYFNKQTSIRLYVRRVLVADQFEDLLPKYLHFVKGVVDSDDLPLNVSREQLQQHKILKVISKKLAKKVLELIKKVSKESDKKRDELEKKLETEEDKSAKVKMEGELTTLKTDFDNLWKEFSRNLKLGCYEDDANRAKIGKLLRFQTLKHDTHPVSLEKYIEEMKEDQSAIYYASGESSTALKNLPQLQLFKKRGVDVVFLTEAMDEPCIQRLAELDGKKFESIQKGEVTLSQTDEEKEREKKVKKLYEPLLMWWRDLLGAGKVQKVEISRRLVDDPVAVVSSQWGYSAYMEKIMKTQTFADSAQLKIMAGQKILEVNPDHPVIKQMLRSVKNDRADEKAKKTAEFLYHAAMLASGFDLQNPQEVSSLMYTMAGAELEVDPEEQVDLVDVSEVEEEVKPKEEEEEESDDEEEEGVEEKDEEEEKEEEEKEKEEEKEEEKKKEEEEKEEEKASEEEEKVGGRKDEEL